MCFACFFPYQYVTLRTRYSELMTLTSQYIKFITDTQRRLEDEEVRDNWLRIPNKLNSNINLTNQPNNSPPNKRVYPLNTKRMHARTFLCVLLMETQQTFTHNHTHIKLMYR